MSKAIRNTKPGMVITDKAEMTQWCVKKIYPFMVLTHLVTDSGALIRRCFSFGDLVTMGMESDEVGNALED